MMQWKGSGKRLQYNFIAPFNDIRMCLIPCSPCRGSKLNKNTNSDIDVINFGTFKPHIYKASGYVGKDNTD